MPNPTLALANLKNEVSNRFEETCACGGVTANDAVAGILQTLAKVCGSDLTSAVLLRAANAIKPVEEQADVLGFDEKGEPVNDVPADLNKYANTIAVVFDKIGDIVGVLDADVCGEIISVARSVEQSQ